jgi:hypothetical protein
MVIREKCWSYTCHDIYMHGYISVDDGNIYVSKRLDIQVWNICIPTLLG